MLIANFRIQRLVRRALVAAVAAAAWVSTEPHASPAAKTTTPIQNPTEAYLNRLLAGDRVALRAGFSTEPAVDDPMGGRVRGVVWFERFVAERRREVLSRQIAEGHGGALEVGTGSHAAHICSGFFVPDGPTSMRQSDFIVLAGAL